MKFTKLSLVAALLAGSAAFAVDNVKVSGDANLYYSTSDAKAGYADPTMANKDDLFGKDNSAADASINLNITADLIKNDMVTLSAGAGYTVLTTLGLENVFVSNVWGSAHTATDNGTSNYAGGHKVENASWMNEAWVAATAGKTTIKLGRMELDTPIAFTEKWSIEKNTFEAAVVMNQDIPDTTLVGAYVGNTNGGGISSNVNDLGLAVAPVVNANGEFNTLGKSGAYAVAAINNSFKPLTAQAWYYDVVNVAKAYWLQADLKCQKVPGLLAGAQYTSVKVGDGDSSGTYALMAGYEMKDMATFKVAYSQTSDKGDLHGQNIGTGTGTHANSQSKLYTEAFWGGNFGQVTTADTTAYKASVDATLAGTDLTAQYTYADHDKLVSSQDLTEVAVAASRTYGPLDLKLAYIYTDLGKNIDASNRVNAYITVNF
ncbi:hypothetical protein [Sulfurimonas marina]|uniref:Porin n=1 Tax=Sulfurimonas marina TaxID=2590551 RepID=A0A7M1AT64_9BACT|nr:hypothetical protein [Sulfurimonas marina]QOP40596.1 hypothetical protein FJR03_02100 [Sulfurimonas marina]